MAQETHEKLAEDAFERGRKFGRNEMKEQCAKVAKARTRREGNQNRPVAKACYDIAAAIRELE